MMVNLSCAFPASLRAFHMFCFLTLSTFTPITKEYDFYHFRFGCAPTYPHYMQPTLEGVCLPHHEKRVSAVKRSTSPSLGTIPGTALDYWHCDIKICHPSIISGYIPSNTWKWLFRPKRDMASNSRAKTLRALSIIYARKRIDKNKHILFCCSGTAMDALLFELAEAAWKAYLSKCS